MDLLTPTTFHTNCPFKGEASSWSLNIDGEIHDGVAWSYETPILQAAEVKGMLSFYPDRTEVTVDGPSLQQSPPACRARSPASQPADFAAVGGAENPTPQAPTGPSPPPCRKARRQTAPKRRAGVPSCGTSELGMSSDVIVKVGHPLPVEAYDAIPHRFTDSGHFWCLVNCYQWLATPSLPEFPDRDYPPLGIRAAQVAAVSRQSLRSYLSPGGSFQP